MADGVLAKQKSSGGLASLLNAFPGFNTLVVIFFDGQHLCYKVGLFNNLWMGISSR